MQQPITNPPVPYVGPIREGLTPGMMIRIQGQVPPTADRFNINLNCGPPPSDTALHMSVRLLQNYIARNSLQDGAWGNEEDSGSLPIAPGQSFEILLLCDPSSFMIAVNGNHFAEFRHRIPFQQISHLAIDGDVSLRVIAFEGGASAPGAPPPPMAERPDYAYGPPPGQYGPPPGPYGQGPYGGGPPRPPKIPMPAPKSLSSVSMPMPSSASLSPAGMPMPSSAPLPPPYMPPKAPGYIPPMPMPTTPSYGPPPSQMPPYGAPPSYVPPPMPTGSFPRHPTAPPSYPAPPAYPAPPSYPTQSMGPTLIPTYPYRTYSGYGPPMYQQQNIKESKLKKAMKYGLPIAGVGLGAFALSHAITHHGSSSSSSSSSDSE